jgi:hypothetical protein
MRRYGLQWLPVDCADDEFVIAGEPVVAVV